MKIGILYGMENTFPGAVVDRINAMRVPDVTAEHIKIGSIHLAEPCSYRVILDRVSHEIPFYRAYLKNAALSGTRVINNPFWWSADDRFFNYSLASKLGVAVPRTVLLPHKSHPPGTTDRSMRNLVYPLDWEGIFRYIGFPAFLKSHSGGRCTSIYKVHNPDEFFRDYDQTGDLCMVLQQGIEFTGYFRCYVVGRENVRVMPYDPWRPVEDRHLKDAPPIDPALRGRISRDCLTVCRALGYDLNAVEFAVQDGIPYAIDVLNPAPDADLYSVGPANFEWIVNAVAGYAISEALRDPVAPDYHWAHFLKGSQRAAGSQ